MPNTVADEITRAKQLARTMIDEYVAWRGKIQEGEEGHTVYMDTLDFVNFRIETADSCLLLLENRRVADALGLCRSLLENHMLFMLTCRGTKFFELKDTHLTGAKFREELKAEQAKVKQLQEAGKTPCIGVEAHPTRTGFLMYIYRGWGSPDPDLPDFRIPHHYFQFRQFNPETMRLKDENYFQYYEPPVQVKKADRKHRLDQETRYRFYLSYDSLLQCLELNGLAGDALQARIEAHYTFLGKFLHPTHDAARHLHEQSNVYDGRTRIGLGQQYTETAVLLGYLYVCYLLAAILDEAASFFEAAPTKYMTNPGTTDLRAATARVPAGFPYFWLLFNDPPLYDRFNYCVHYATDEELTAWGGYANVPLERVPFDQHIYGHLKQALISQRNVRCGDYRSPLD
jgi:hypothetical protein